MILYILHSGLILASCLSFYKVLLQKETFYQLNRFVLLGCLVLSFSLPLIPIPQQFSFKSTKITEDVVPSKLDSYSNTVTHIQIQQTSSASNVEAENVALPINFAQIKILLIYLYWFGVVAFTLNFLVQLISLMSKVRCNPVIQDGRFLIVELLGEKAPCSFGNIIFINPEKYDWETYDQILQHEKIHIQQRHSIDILLAEIGLIFQWFNPFAWLYRIELENNLEFLTDDQLLHRGKVEKTSYQINLLKVSAPHFPLSLTTNYNQSLLKKRVVMMNAKKSNINSTWKYFFLFPLFVTFMSLLNKPVALAQALSAKKNSEKGRDQHNNTGLATEGSWFATIKNNKLLMQFKNNDDDSGSFNSSTFSLTEFKDLPKENAGTFTLTREAGIMQFMGKFEGNQGMGRYKFTANKGLNDYLRKEDIDVDEDSDMIVFFMVDVKRSYVQMLKREGYSRLSKSELIPLAALKVDAAYIQLFKQEGLRNISLQDLIPLKSLGVNSEYIKDIRKAGYKNITVGQLITFKSQGIEGKYIAKMHSVTEKESKPESGEKASIKVDKNKLTDYRDIDPSVNELVAIKALNIDAEYIRSLKQGGYDHLSNSNLIAMKSQDITADYIKSLGAMGYKNISPSELIAIKTQNITQDYIKDFEAVGYTNISMQDLLSLKAFGVSLDFIKSFKDVGFKDIALQDAVALKVQAITPGLINQYKERGFTNISLSDVISATATGTTPSFIDSMKKKGFNGKSIQKYIQLKTSFE